MLIKTKQLILVLAAIALLVLCVVSVAQTREETPRPLQPPASQDTESNASTTQHSGEVWLAPANRYVSIPDYKSDRSHQIKKVSAEETLRQMAARRHPNGVFEEAEMDNRYSIIPEAKGVYTYSALMPDGTSWNERVYDLGSYYWLEYSVHEDAHGLPLNKPAGHAPPEPEDTSTTTSESNTQIYSLGVIVPKLRGKTTTCAGLSSYNNPYDCCWADIKNFAGVIVGQGPHILANCTFGAWEFAKESWSVEISDKSWGYAKDWAGNASVAGFPVASTPKLFSIAQYGAKNTVPTGHVAFLMSVDSTGRVDTNEQDCMETFTRYDYRYTTNPFTSYIQKKNGQTVGLYALYASYPYNTSGQTVGFLLAQPVYYSFSGLSPTFLVTFPNGGVAQVGSSAYTMLYGYFLNIKLTLASRGLWKIQAFYPNVDYSNELQFTVR